MLYLLHFLYPAKSNQTSIYVTHEQTIFTDGLPPSMLIIPSSRAAMTASCTTGQVRSRGQIRGGWTRSRGSHVHLIRNVSIENWYRRSLGRQSLVSHAAKDRTIDATPYKRTRY